MRNKDGQESLVASIEGMWGLKGGGDTLPGLPFSSTSLTPHLLNLLSGKTVAKVVPSFKVC